jgi:hypothetical protein
VKWQWLGLHELLNQRGGMTPDLAHGGPASRSRSTTRKPASSLTTRSTFSSSCSGITSAPAGVGSNALVLPQAQLDRPEALLRTTLATEDRDLLLGRVGDFVVGVSKPRQVIGRASQAVACGAYGPAGFGLLPFKLVPQCVCPRAGHAVCCCPCAPCETWRNLGDDRSPSSGCGQGEVS